jgi:hypothetical protein
MSANATSDDLDTAFQHGMHFFSPKPSDPGLLTFITRTKRAYPLAQAIDLIAANSKGVYTPKVRLTDPFPPLFSLSFLSLFSFSLFFLSFRSLFSFSSFSPLFSFALWLSPHHPPTPPFPPFHPKRPFLPQTLFFTPNALFYPQVGLIEQHVRRASIDGLDPLAQYLDTSRSVESSPRVKPTPTPPAQNMSWPKGSWKLFRRADVKSHAVAPAPAETVSEKG